MSERRREVSKKKLNVVDVLGIEPLMTVADIAALVQRPRRWVMGVIKTGQLKGVKLGGNSWRVEPAEYRRWLAAGAPSGAQHARPSGGVRDGMIEAGCRVVRRGQRVVEIC